MRTTWLLLQPLLFSVLHTAAAFSAAGRPAAVGMGRKGGGRRRSGRTYAKARTAPTTATDSILQSQEPNFVFEAGPGCHIARPGAVRQQDDWVLEWESIDPSDFAPDDEIPDIAVDPEDRTLTLCNTREKQVVAYITVYDLPLRDRRGQLLQQGTTTDNDGATRPCTTLIALCPPRTFAHLCTIDHDISDLQDLPLDSDVSVYVPHPDPADTHARSIAFPLGGDHGPYLCTQGEDGVLTHFLPGNLHAIDLECPVGTPLLAVGDGVVVDVQDSHAHLTGIAVTNLYKWNSIMLRLEDDDGEDDPDPLFVEYVHAASACVRQGDRVTCGQVIGHSGGVGFSPRPHLHLAAYRSSRLTAPTVRVRLRAADGSTYLPRAGAYYDATGLVSRAETSHSDK